MIYGIERLRVPLINPGVDKPVPISIILSRNNRKSLRRLIIWQLLRHVYASDDINTDVPNFLLYVKIIEERHDTLVYCYIFIA